MVLYGLVDELRSILATNADRGSADGIARAQSRHEDGVTFFGYQRVDKALKNPSIRQLGL